MITPFEIICKEENLAPSFYQFGVDVHAQRFVYTMHFVYGAENKHKIVIVRHTYSGIKIGRMEPVEVIERFAYFPGHEQYELPQVTIDYIEKVYKECYYNGGVEDRRNIMYRINVIRNEFVRAVVLDMDDVIIAMALGYCPQEDPAKLKEDTMRYNDKYRSFVHHLNGEQILLFK